MNTEIVDNIHRLLEDSWLKYFRKSANVPKIIEVSVGYFIFEYGFTTFKYEWVTESKWSNMSIIDVYNVGLEDMKYIVSEVWEMWDDLDELFFE